MDEWWFESQLAAAGVESSHMFNMNYYLQFMHSFSIQQKHALTLLSLVDIMLCVLDLHLSLAVFSPPHLTPPWERVYNRTKSSGTRKRKLITHSSTANGKSHHINPVDKCASRNPPYAPNKNYNSWAVWRIFVAVASASDKWTGIYAWKAEKYQIVFHCVHGILWCAE